MDEEASSAFLFAVTPQEKRNTALARLSIEPPKLISSLVPFWMLSPEMGEGSIPYLDGLSAAFDTP